MLLGEYIYGGHWPLDFEVLRAMIIQRLNYALQRFIIALIRQVNPLNGGALYMKHASW